MNYTIVWTRCARKELYGVYEYYALRRQEIADQFLKSIYEKLEIVKRFPESFQVYRGKPRKCVLRKFPYFIYVLYKRKAEIRITMIAHMSRQGINLNR